MSTANSENIFAAEETALTEEDIEKKRNIWRMSERMHTRNIKQEYQGGLGHDSSVKSLRSAYVRFGTKSGINAGVCWPLKEVIVDMQDNERKFFKTFDQLKDELEERRGAEQKAFADREAEIDENLSKLKQWREEMLAREEKVKAQLAQKKAKMNELIREVREHIGYNLDPSDPKFQEVMEMKENERKAAEKEARKLAKKERMMQRLMSVPTAAATVKAPPPLSTAETTQSDPKPPTPEVKSPSEGGDSK